MFLLQAEGAKLLDVDAIRGHLETIGESVLVAGDPRAVKVHVHSERPDEVIGYGLGLGALSRISVENLDNQARDVRETRAAEFTGAAERATGADAAPAASHNGTGPAVAGLPLAVVAVAPGDGLAAIFRDFGVAAVVRGGQSANPSTGELMDALSRIDAREILLLPNNPNVVMAARQVASMSERPVVVVPTRNAAEGFAALLALDPARSAADNADGMTQAGRAVQTLAVTDAVRDATIGGRKVKRGQTIVLDPDDGLVACGNDPAKAVLAGVGALQPGFELLTVYYGDGADLADAEEVARRLGAQHDGVEVEVVHGGQPHYRYLIAAE
jgi:dihydroxyacetone kinase-like predicted kinase